MSQSSQVSLSRGLLLPVLLSGIVMAALWLQTETGSAWLTGAAVPVAGGAGSSAAAPVTAVLSSPTLATLLALAATALLWTGRLVAQGMPPLVAFLFSGLAYLNPAVLGTTSPHPRMAFTLLGATVGVLCLEAALRRLSPWLARGATLLRARLTVRRLAQFLITVCAVLAFVAVAQSWQFPVTNDLRPWTGASAALVPFPSLDVLGHLGQTSLAGPWPIPALAVQTAAAIGALIVAVWIWSSRLAERGLTRIAALAIATVALANPLCLSILLADPRLALALVSVTLVLQATARIGSATSVGDLVGSGLLVVAGWIIDPRFWLLLPGLVFVLLAQTPTAVRESSRTSAAVTVLFPLATLLGGAAFLSSLYMSPRALNRLTSGFEGMPELLVSLEPQPMLAVFLSLSLLLLFLISYASPADLPRRFVLLALPAGALAGGYAMAGHAGLFAGLPVLMIMVLELTDGALATLTTRARSVPGASVETPTALPPPRRRELSPAIPLMPQTHTER